MIDLASRALNPASVNTITGRRPDCSVPLTGSKSIQAMSPASGIFVVDDLVANVRPPLHRLWRVFRPKTIHLGKNPLQRDLLRPHRLDDAFAVLDSELHALPRLQAEFVQHRFRQPDGGAVAPFGYLNLGHRGHLDVYPMY